MSTAMCVVDEMGLAKTGHLTKTLYHFCDKRKRPDEAASHILRSLIHQLLSWRPSLFAIVLERSGVMDSHSFSRGTSVWTFDALWAIFKTIVTHSQLREICCVIDGLDECESNSIETFLSLLPQLLSQADKTTSKLFLTSRPSRHITSSLRGHTSVIWVNPEDTKYDIETYVRTEGLIRLKGALGLSPQEEQEVQKELVDRSEGMFLWADLAIKEAERTRGLKENELAIIRSLPSGLDALYHQMLVNIDKGWNTASDIRLIQVAFTWAVLAARPPTLAELRIGFALEPLAKSMASVKLLRNITHDLQTLCGPFVDIRQAGDRKTGLYHQLPISTQPPIDDRSGPLAATLRLIHQSAKEYLVDNDNKLREQLSKFRVNPETGHAEMAQKCLTYLLFEDFKTGPIGLTAVGSTTDTDAELRKLIQGKLASNGFLEYAALFWQVHVQQSSGDNQIVTTLACEFLSDSSMQFESWYQVFCFLRNSETRYDSGYSGLHAAASSGLYEVVCELLNRGAEIDKTSAYNQTALHYAAQSGHLKVVHLLLCRGAELEAKDAESRNALHHAARGGHTDVIQFLLDRGVMIDGKAIHSRTALHYAARDGHLEVTQLLLNRGAETDAEDTCGWTALHYAAQNGYQHITQLLLNQLANIKAKDSYGLTALHYAARDGHVEVVQLLLSCYAEIQVKDANGRDALHFAARGGHLDAVRLLLERGAEINGTAEGGLTALHYATRDGHQKVVELALNEGADIEIEDGDGWTALHFAAQSGYQDVVRLLLDRGARIELMDAYSWTALHYAARDNHLQVVKLLLNRGASARTKDNSDRTALHIASRDNRKDVARSLLDQGAEVNGRATNGLTALHYAAREGNRDLVVLLAACGADIKASDNDSWTALHYAAQNGHVEVARLLIGLGSCVEARDVYAWTALGYADRYGHLEVKKLLESALASGHSAHYTALNGSIANSSQPPEKSGFKVSGGLHGEFMGGSGQLGGVRALDGHQAVVKAPIKSSSERTRQGNKGLMPNVVARFFKGVVKLSHEVTLPVRPAPEASPTQSRIRGPTRVRPRSTTRQVVHPCPTKEGRQTRLSSAGARRPNRSAAGRPPTSSSRRCSSQTKHRPARRSTGPPESGRQRISFIPEESPNE
ncbi:MAG: hypothetical protein M1840_002375 [Geoglossum simile]|nr:MAG: hypothetical protein M1840_002375 [Geoglossum simile]